MPVCTSCGHDNDGYTGKFCAECGTLVQTESKGEPTQVNPLGEPSVVGRGMEDFTTNSVPDYSQAGDNSYLSEPDFMVGAKPKVTTAPKMIAAVVGVILLILVAAAIFTSSGSVETTDANKPQASAGPAPPSPCLVPDTAGSPCSDTVEVHKSGTICFMPSGGYLDSVACTWHISCSNGVAPAFVVTQLETEADYDTVALYSDGTVDGQPLAQLSGTLSDQPQLNFDGDTSRGLTIEFRSDDGTATGGFAGTYSCQDHCLHPFVDCGAHGECLHGAGAAAGVCVCTEGYSGEQCDVVPDLCDHVSCGSHGSCDAGICTCSAGYSSVVSSHKHRANCTVAPDRCEYPRHVSCGSHGSCSGGSCSCRDGYRGSSCQSAPDRCEYPRQVSCGSHGSCSNGACSCRDGYSGSRCDSHVTYSLHARSLCAAGNVITTLAECARAAEFLSLPVPTSVYAPNCGWNLG